MSEESKFSFTTKIDGDLFTIRGNNAQEFRQNLAEVGNMGLGAEIRSMVTAANNTASLNNVLGAVPVDSPQAQESPQWGQNPQQAQPQQAPTQEQSPWAASEPPQAQTQPQWGGQNQFSQQPSAGGAKPWLYDASIQPPHLTPPQTPWGPAKYKGGVSKQGKNYRLWGDPRPWSELKNIPEDQRFPAQFINESEL